MTAQPRLTLTATVLDAPEPGALAAFYQRLLGWEIRAQEPDWVALAGPGGGPGLSFQAEPQYQPPVWPAGDGDPQMMSHLDIEVDDLAGGVEHALAAGATLAEFQPQDDVRVMLDPVGHPFCLWIRT